MAVNIARRKKVMARSIKLGHCVCNPKKPCPCDTFKAYNICTCAGEKPAEKTKTIALTSHVKKAGCASKIGQADLSRILGALPPLSDSNVLVGTASGDDAGVYRIGEHMALVQTVDVFSPCVDDPYLFGRIAASNSVSDVYAMGGKPLTALSIIGFPIDNLDGSIMEQLLLGGMKTLEEAGCSLIGGHSINDDEIKSGFAVTGLIDPDNVFERNAAHDGDVLVLTKPLGTGIVCFGAQIGAVGDKALAEVGDSMATLNKDAAELMSEYGAHACTDVTGFGLAGHLVEMVRTNGLTAEIDMRSLPVFRVAYECMMQEVLPGAIERNQEYSMAHVIVPDESDELNLSIIYDPQTSGGLLISLPENLAKAFVEEMHKRGHAATSIIGRIISSAETAKQGKIVITDTRLEHFIGSCEPVSLKKAKQNMQGETLNRHYTVTVPDDSCCEGSHTEQCCDNPPVDTDVLPSFETPAAFGDFMKKANASGAIDARAKKLMAIALSVAERCRPCLVSHMKSALSMGISRREIDEAAYLAISFAGCPSMMLYKEVCEEVYG